MEPKRARRIRDRQRMKARARSIAKHVWEFGPNRHSRNVEAYERWLKSCEKLAEHLAHCHKQCCNRRRHTDGPTMQERCWFDLTRDMKTDG
jgi:hypothetical protein